LTAQRDPGGAFRCGFHLISFVFQSDGHHLSDIRFIVNQDDSPTIRRLHGKPSLSVFSIHPELFFEHTPDIGEKTIFEWTVTIKWRSPFQPLRSALVKGVDWLFQTGCFAPGLKQPIKSIFAFFAALR